MYKINNKLFADSHLSLLIGRVHSSFFGVSELFYLCHFYRNKCIFQANSVDPDETPHYAASHVGLHCLLISHLWNVRHKWVNPLNSW